MVTKSIADINRQIIERTARMKRLAEESRTYKKVGTGETVTKHEVLGHRYETITPAGEEAPKPIVITSYKELEKAIAPKTTPSVSDTMAITPSPVVSVAGETPSLVASVSEEAPKIERRITPIPAYLQRLKQAQLEGSTYRRVATGEIVIKEGGKEKTYAPGQILPEKYAGIYSTKLKAGEGGTLVIKTPEELVKKEVTIEEPTLVPAVVPTVLSTFVEKIPISEPLGDKEAIMNVWDTSSTADVAAKIGVARDISQYNADVFSFNQRMQEGEKDEAGYKNLSDRKNSLIDAWKEKYPGFEPEYLMASPGEPGGTTNIGELVQNMGQVVGTKRTIQDLTGMTTAGSGAVISEYQRPGGTSYILTGTGGGWVPMRPEFIASDENVIKTLLKPRMDTTAVFWNPPDTREIATEENRIRKTAEELASKIYPSLTMKIARISSNISQIKEYNENIDILNSAMREPNLITASSEEDDALKAYNDGKKAWEENPTEENRKKLSDGYDAYMTAYFRKNAVIAQIRGKYKEEGIDLNKLVEDAPAMALLSEELNKENEALNVDIEYDNSNISLISQLANESIAKLESTDKLRNKIEESITTEENVQRLLPLEETSPAGIKYRAFLGGLSVVERIGLGALKSTRDISLLGPRWVKGEREIWREGGTASEKILSVLPITGIYYPLAKETVDFSKLGKAPWGEVVESNLLSGEIGAALIGAGAIGHAVEKGVVETAGAIAPTQTRAILGFFGRPAISLATKAAGFAVGTGLLYGGDIYGMATGKESIGRGLANIEVTTGSALAIMSAASLAANPEQLPYASIYGRNVVSGIEKPLIQEIYNPITGKPIIYRTLGPEGEYSWGIGKIPLSDLSFVKGARYIELTGGTKRFIKAGQDTVNIAGKEYKIYGTKAYLIKPDNTLNENIFLEIKSPAVISEVTKYPQALWMEKNIKSLIGETQYGLMYEPSYATLSSLREGASFLGVSPKQVLTSELRGFSSETGTAIKGIIKKWEGGFGGSAVGVSREALPKARGVGDYDATFKYKFQAENAAKEIIGALKEAGIEVKIDPANPTHVLGRSSETGQWKSLADLHYEGQPAETTLYDVTGASTYGVPTTGKMYPFAEGELGTTVGQEYARKFSSVFRIRTTPSGELGYYPAFHREKDIRDYFAYREFIDIKQSGKISDSTINLKAQFERLYPNVFNEQGELTVVDTQTQESRIVPFSSYKKIKKSEDIVIPTWSTSIGSMDINIADYSSIFKPSPKASMSEYYKYVTPSSSYIKEDYSGGDYSGGGDSGGGDYSGGGGSGGGGYVPPSPYVPPSGYVPPSPSPYPSLSPSRIEPIKKINEIGFPDMGLDFGESSKKAAFKIGLTGWNITNLIRDLPGEWITRQRMKSSGYRPAPIPIMSFSQTRISRKVPIGLQRAGISVGQTVGIGMSTKKKIQSMMRAA